MSRRTPSFTEEEKSCLVELVIKHKLNLNTTLSCNPSTKNRIWARLTDEFNSIESNSNRTQNQLKKCWANIKTKKKAALSLEKKERMRTGGGRFPSPRPTDFGEIGDELTATTDLELRFAIDCDSLAEPPADVQEFGPEDEVPEVTQRSPQTQDPQRQRRQTSNGRNIRANVIAQEFELRVEQYKRSEAREQELHKLKVEERKWLVKVAEEAYQKARLERLSAEHLLRFSEATREEAERKQK